jgi:hypothetical protein
MPKFETKVLGRDISVKYEISGGVKVRANTSRTPRMDVRILGLEGMDPENVTKFVKRKVQAAIREDMGFHGQLIASWGNDIRRSKIRSYHVVDEDGTTETTTEEIRELFGSQPIQSTE